MATTWYARYRHNPLAHDLQRKIKVISGTWYPSKKRWHAPEQIIKRIGLTKRIVR